MRHGSTRSVSTPDVQPLDFRENLSLPFEIADVPPALDDIILKAMATEKDDRYESVIYLRDDLQDLFESL